MGSEDSFGNKGQGELVGPGIWETTPQYGKWLPFPAQRKWYLFPQQLAGTDFARVLVYISAAEEPNPTEQYTLASGDSALIRQFPDGRNHGVEVKNNTCADFFVRVVIEGYPQAGAADAGADGDASASDATGDATLTDGASE